MEEQWPFTSNSWHTICLTYYLLVDCAQVVRAQNIKGPMMPVTILVPWLCPLPVPPHRTIRWEAQGLSGGWHSLKPWKQWMLWVESPGNQSTRSRTSEIVYCIVLQHAYKLITDTAAISCLLCKIYDEVSIWSLLPLPWDFYSIQKINYKTKLKNVRKNSIEIENKNKYNVFFIVPGQTMQPATDWELKKTTTVGGANISREEGVSAKY